MKRDPIAKYLAKRADLDSRPLVSGTLTSIDQVVVIPALAEYEHLFDTLDSLRNNPAAELAHTLVLCVVNNRAIPHADAAMIANNQRTLKRLEALVQHGKVEKETPLRLAYVDASSAGHELPSEEGVGLARKIGLDWGLAVLRDSESSCRLLFSLDADTLVDFNYLAAVRRHYEAHDGWGSVIAYAHRFDGTAEENTAIVYYELFLRYYALGMSYAGSPYAFHTIGSTMVCRAKAYAAISGMNRRQAGEDFYFLQQLAKTGHVDTLHSTCVYPSCRGSHRVPFGTGARVRAFQETPDMAYMTYDPAVFRILKQWLSLVEVKLDASVEDLLGGADEISEALRTFLEANGFERTWVRLKEHSAGSQGLLAQFHRWFDGLKTLRLIHYLRDNGYPQRDLFDAFNELMTWVGEEIPMGCGAALHGNDAGQQALLAFLRNRDREMR